MTKTEAKQIAKETVMENLAVAYYKVCNGDYSDDEELLICKYINKYGTTMAKSIGEQYYTM